MGFFIDALGSYYAGDQASIHDIGVPERPTPWHYWSGSDWTVDGAALRAHALAKITTACEAAIAGLRTSYPESEVLSWSQQSREADALAAAPDAEAPLLSAIAASRGLPVTELATRVRAKVTAYAMASGQIIGQRQALEDQLMAVDLQAADVAEQLAAITWPAA